MRLLFALITIFAATTVSAESITVSAAISLKEALADVAGAYGREKVELNFGATGQLLAQIREGAPVDLFIAASDEQMDQAEAQELVDRATRRVIAGNRLVLVVAKDSKLKIASFADLASAEVKRLAIGQPRTVPAGDYAMQALRHLKLESALTDRLVHGSSVRQVLDYVERGEVDGGIVYATDVAAAGGKVRVVAEADASWHRPIRYVAAVVRASGKREATGRFLDFLSSENAAVIFARRGFVAAPSSSTSAATRPRPK